MFKRILIANRGEIALRIVRACKELGIESVVAYAEPDEHSLPVQVADRAICIGPAAASESYLKISAIISAAEVVDAEAIHPGYGFLAENAHFAEVCRDCNIQFIGPEPDAIRQLGDKAVAIETMKKAGVPVTPGSDGIIPNEEAAVEKAREIGYPVLVKASAGGGGKGMRLARNDGDVAKAFATARNEAARAFGNADVYLEKFIENARHIEVQLLGDKHGNIVHLGERDCSIQRRHQKLLEECPSPALTADARKKIGRTAVKGAQAVKYSNAGTMEFLYDEKTQKFFFIEMNTRIQVEHPVTEMVTGIDLVKEMIRVAAGEKLSFSQRDVDWVGHAIEFRINAENPYRDFTPSPGTVEWVCFPGGPGVRIDSHVYSGYEIPPHYDSMVAKVIVHGANRAEALARLRRALSEFMIEGPYTTLPLGLALLQDESFRHGAYDTKFLERFLADGKLGAPSQPAGR
jgi:acetyl-CoA carboxylase biotin carboxylase subunit